jgi:hypothetical protein
VSSRRHGAASATAARLHTEARQDLLGGAAWRLGDVEQRRPAWLMAYTATRLGGRDSAAHGGTAMASDRPCRDAGAFIPRVVAATGTAPGGQWDASGGRQCH